jgi:hypothetical protein
MATDPTTDPAVLDNIIDPDKLFSSVYDPLAQLAGEPNKHHSMLCHAATVPIWDRNVTDFAAQFKFSRQWMSRVYNTWNWENRLHENDLLIARRARARSILEVNAVAANLTSASATLSEHIVKALDTHLTAKSISAKQLAPLLSVLLRIAEHQMPGAEERSLADLDRELANLDTSPRPNPVADMLRSLSAKPDLIDQIVDATTETPPP